jgi:L-lactate dehydrogenase
MNELKPKISIIGCGNVGVRYAYALMIKSFARKIVLVDINKAKAEGEAMDLSHGAPYVSPVEIMAGDYEDIADSDIVVITAGMKQKEGESRLELADANVKLMKKITPQIMDISPDSIILIATNPVDVLSYAVHQFSGKPFSKVIGSGTVLDTARFRTQISKHCGIDARNVHAYILGEHGDTEFPVWSKAMIGGMMINNYCNICEKRSVCRREKELEMIFVQVRDSAYKIIDRKGETSYGIGLAMTRITQAILNNENSVLPVSTRVKGYYGVDDVYLSLPSIVDKNGINQQLKLELSPEEQGALKKSGDKLKSVLKKVGF